ncbi:Plasmodium exported protein, unknown function [Plasmodium gonderi]|uniref:Variable surface protein n=1 Tax=Plasmodium gonderi TaxID=77519 RepID=A0A1Y1JF68_PLAGO|nr:Plasmodium exported protein, unknown function [Plasmodium gonderi]GAW79857.1 Plasmodium exported protein, unknown function [Plasmodium gonderi]
MTGISKFHLFAKTLAIFFCVLVHQNLKNDSSINKSFSNVQKIDKSLNSRTCRLLSKTDVVGQPKQDDLKKCKMNEMEEIDLGLYEEPKSPNIFKRADQYFENKIINKLYDVESMSMIRHIDKRGFLKTSWKNVFLIYLLPLCIVLIGALLIGLKQLKLLGSFEYISYISLGPTVLALLPLLYIFIKVVKHIKRWKKTESYLA